MVELENSIVPELNSPLRLKKRYTDDTLTIVQEGSIEQLNSFHPNIQFTFEMESSGIIPSLEIFNIPKKSSIETTVSKRVQTQRHLS